MICLTFHNFHYISLSMSRLGLARFILNYLPILLLIRRRLSASFRSGCSPRQVAWLVFAAVLLRAPRGPFCFAEGERSTPNSSAFRRRLHFADEPDGHLYNIIHTPIPAYCSSHSRRLWFNF